MSERTAAKRGSFERPLAVKMVMLDLDGTLIDTAPDIAASANLMLQELGLPARDRDTITSWIGNGASRLVKRALTGELEAEPMKALYERAYPLFLKHYGERVSRESRLYPGATEALQRLREAGFALTCITNKPEAFTVPLLRDFGVHRYFGLIVSGDTLSGRKPDPLPLLHACEHFGIGPEHAVLVGDSMNDAEAGRAAGMPVICVTYGYNRGTDLRQLRPAAVIDNLTELLNHIRLYTE